MFSVKDLSIASVAASANYTSTVDLRKCDPGAEFMLYYSSLTTTSIAITQQCSMDNKTWKEAVTAYNVTVGAVATAANATAHDRLIQLTPVMAPYIRFNVTATGTEGSIKLILAYQEY